MSHVHQGFHFLLKDISHTKDMYKEHPDTEQQFMNHTFFSIMEIKPAKKGRRGDSQTTYVIRAVIIFQLYDLIMYKY